MLFREENDEVDYLNRYNDYPLRNSLSLFSLTQFTLHLLLPVGRTVHEKSNN